MDLLYTYLENSTSGPQFYEIYSQYMDGPFSDQGCGTPLQSVAIPIFDLGQIKVNGQLEIFSIGNSQATVIPEIPL